MTLTLVTLTLPDTDSVFTEFNGHCHSSSILLPPAPSLPFGRGLGAQPPMPVSPRLRQPSLPSHAPTLPPGPSSAVGSHAGREDSPHGPVPLPMLAKAGWTGQRVTGLIAR